MEAMTERQAVSYGRWVQVLRGIVAIIFGIIALATPGITLLALIFLFGIFALIDGVVAIVNAVFRRKESPNWGILLLDGILGILIGAAALLWPGATAIILLYIIASWAVVTGIIEIVAAFSLAGGIGHEWGLALAGLVSVIFGILLFLNPIPGILSLVWVLGIYAIVYGIFMLVRAIQNKPTPYRAGVFR